jgi:glutamate N-acetyltransferase/amino-acid N-acetyltransferase
VTAGVTFARGFRAAGVTAGFKPSGQPDLALLAGPDGTTAAGLFTTNRVAAAPVHLSRARLGAGRGTAVLVNSGQANAATGARGDDDALAATEGAARLLELDVEDVLACSTGVIGEPLHMPQILAALPGLVESLSQNGGGTFARAIMTTDTVSKQATVERGPYRVGGAAKGVGMISPNLATMLAFLTTDAPVGRDHLQRLADEQLKPRFNALTVDACTSTNDAVLVLASGAAGGDPVTPGTDAWSAVEGAVAEVGESLVSQLIHDAEGVSHVLLIDVDGARDDDEARVVAKAVADSPLVKAAAFGRDPNPGRVLQAVGSSGADIDAERVDIWIGGTQLVVAGTIPLDYFADDGLRSAAGAAMHAPEIVVRVRLGDGPGRSRALGCDLSYEYVRINGEYTT